MPQFCLSGWTATADAADTLIPNLIPAAGLTIAAGRRAVIRRMSGFSNRIAAINTMFYLARTAMGAANRIAALNVPGCTGVTVNTYVYIDATAAAVPLVLSDIGAGAGALAVCFSCSGYFE